MLAQKEVAIVIGKLYQPFTHTHTAASAADEAGQNQR